MLVLHAQLEVYLLSCLLITIHNIWLMPQNAMSQMPLFLLA